MGVNANPVSGNGLVARIRKGLTELSNKKTRARFKNG